MFLGLATVNYHIVDHIERAIVKFFTFMPTLLFNKPYFVDRHEPTPYRRLLIARELAKAYLLHARILDS